MGIENVGLEKPILSIAIGNAYKSKNVSVSVKIWSCHTVTNCSCQVMEGVEKEKAIANIYLHQTSNIKDYILQKEM